jgi:vacuolar-type H+-ATPase subunit C/Vma6
MPLVSANLSTDFVFPKLHGRWAAAVKGEKLAALIRGGTVQAVARTLAETGVIVTDRLEVQKRLNEKLIREYTEMARLLPPALAAFYVCLADRALVDNLKTILHYRYFPKPTPNIHSLLISAPQLPQLPTEKLLEARSVHQFHLLLPRHPFTEHILPVLVELDDSRDLFVAEAQMDALYFRLLLETAGQTPLPVRRLAEGLVQAEIDIINIVLLLRNLSLYKLTAAEVMRLLIGGSSFPGAASAADAAAAPSAERLAQLLPRQYRAAVAGVDGRPLYQAENALWCILYTDAETAFRDFNHPERSAVAYPYLKRFEHLNLARLFEGLVLGLNPALLESMMIGRRHV